MRHMHAIYCFTNDAGSLRSLHIANQQYHVIVCICDPNPVEMEETSHCLGNSSNRCHRMAVLKGVMESEVGNYWLHIYS